MKKYSADFFKKKFKILFNKLLIREGFIDEIKKERKELGIPVEKGFADSLELAEFLLKKFSGSEEKNIIMISFINKFEVEKHIHVSKENKEEFFKYFDENFLRNKDNALMPIAYLLGIIEEHNNLFTSDKLLKETKFFSKLSPIVLTLANKYWGVDLFDEIIAINFIEKFLFLGENGVNQYIEHRVTCPSCRYIGIDHFSPDRCDMQGQKKGVYDKSYIFNKNFVKRLSFHFNSVFLVIKPYATKEEVLNYVEDNWHWLKEHLLEKNTFYKQFDVSPSKIKKSDFDRNAFIYSMYKKSKKDLIKENDDLNIDPSARTYKETIIADILDRKYDIKISSDAVKKAATRFAKSTKLKKEPRDIRDI